MAKKDIMKEPKLPSQHQIGDMVDLYLAVIGEDTTVDPPTPARVFGVHFYKGKVKYDLEITYYGGWSTRVYNVDGVLVLKYKQRG